MTLRVVLNMVLGNRALIDHLAGRVYEDETLKHDWEKKQPADKAIWLQRVQSTITALVGTLGV